MFSFVSYKVTNCKPCGALMWTQLDSHKAPLINVALCQITPIFVNNR